MNQREEEIKAERDGDDQSDDRLSHGATLLELPEGERVGAHQRQKCNADRDEHYVEHDRLLNGALHTPSRVSFRSRIGWRGIRIS